MRIIYSFKPVFDNKSGVLILGSVPGGESLRKKQYYAHERNAFWPLISALLNMPCPEDYQARLNMLLSRGIALWDVIKSCERKGSLDSNIKNETINDFADFFIAHTKIKHVFFNGGKAYSLFKSRVGFAFDNIGFTKLGSTSPAHAVTFESRISDWKQILPYLI